MEGERWEPNVNVETGNWDIVFTRHSGIRPEFPKDLADRLSVIRRCEAMPLRRRAAPRFPLAESVNFLKKLA